MAVAQLAGVVPDRPRFHLLPRAGGWINDPNGLLFYRGVWHVFYQYLPGSAKWDWGLGWGHCVSTDNGVHWRELPPALMPTPGSLDGDGCFSGCACIDESTGTPMLLYTGVRLRSSPSCGPLPPPAYDLNLPFIESQLAAWPADPEDPFLQVWCKRNVPILSLPPPNMNLSGWRDPYITSTPSTSADGKYTMLLGSGVKNTGGNVLMYKSSHLLRDWQYHGMLCQDSGGVSGLIWECPLIAELEPTPPRGQPLPAAGADAQVAACSQQPSTMFSPKAAGTAARPTALLELPTQPDVRQQLLPNGLTLQPPPPGAAAHATHSALLDGCEGAAAGVAAPTRAHTPVGPLARLWPAETSTTAGSDGEAAAPHLPERRFFFCISPDACTNPTLFWLGRVSRPDAFDYEDALGPHRLDFGDILYAPNLCRDHKGRVLLLAWLQERRKVGGEYTYAGCLSTPRVLSLDVTDPQAPRLVQQPLPELVNLRVQGSRRSSKRLAGGGGGGANGLAWAQQQGGVKSEDLMGGCEGGGAGVGGEVPEQEDVWGLKVPGLQPSAFCPSPPSPLLTLREEDDEQVDGGSDVARLADGGGGAERRWGQKGAGARVGGSGSATAAAALAARDGVVSRHSAADSWGSWDEAAAALLQAPAVPADGCCEARAGPDGDGGDMGLELGLGVGITESDPLRVGAGQSVPVPGIRGCFLHVDMEVHFAPGDPLGTAARAADCLPLSGMSSPRAASVDGQSMPGAAVDACDGAEEIGPEGEGQGGLMSGLVLRSWVSAQGGSAALLYCWRTSTLEVVFEAVDPETHQFSLGAPDVRRVGGRLQRPPAPGEPLRLRLLLDASLLEVFTADGEVLSTRVYRGAPPPSRPPSPRTAAGLDRGWDGVGAGGCGGGGDGGACGMGAAADTCGVDVISVGGTTLVPHLAAWEVESFWREGGESEVAAGAAGGSCEQALDAAAAALKLMPLI